MPKHDPYRTPSKFPVPLDEFLRLVVGGRYKADRLKLYRDYLGESIIGGSLGTLDSIEQTIKHNRSHGIPQLFFRELRENFLVWRAMKRKAQGRAAAKKRWAKD